MGGRAAPVGPRGEAALGCSGLRRQRAEWAGRAGVWRSGLAFPMAMKISSLMRVGMPYLSINSSTESSSCLSMKLCPSSNIGSRPGTIRICGGVAAGRGAERRAGQPRLLQTLDPTATRLLRKAVLLR